MNSRLAGTVLEAGIVKPLLFCSGVVLLGATVAVVQGWWRLLTSEDMDIDYGDDDLPLLPDLRGTA